MAFVDSYDHDVFISYARVDNEPLTLRGEKVQWIDRFHTELEGRVNEELKGNAKFWRDDNDLPGNKLVTPEIAEAISKTATIVVVLSPGYLESAWCRKEIADFKRRMTESGGPQSRMFLVKLRDFDYEDQPTELKDLIGYNFFNKELNAAISPNEDDFYFELIRLRTALAACLKDLKQHDDPDSTLSADPAVYLAEPTPDIQRERNKISVQINKLGYRVLPARYYARSREEFEKAAKTDLDAAKLFIQLLGPVGTFRTNDFPDGYEGLQAELAQHLPKIRAYYRDTFDFSELDPDHRDLLRASDVIATTPSELEQLIKKTLADIKLRESRSGATKTIAPSGQSVFVQTTEDDYDDALNFCKHLEQEAFGYEIIEDGEPIQDLADSQDPDGLIVFCGGNVKRPWIKNSVRTVKDLRLERRPREPACGVFVCPPHHPESLPIHLPFLHTIAESTLRPSLDNFLEEVRNRQPAL